VGLWLEVEPHLRHHFATIGSGSPGSARPPILRSDRGADGACSAAAMGERTAFMVQTNSTDAIPAMGSAHAQPSQMQHAEQREQAPRGIEIDVDLALQARLQQRRAFVVQAAAAHVERFDLRRRRGADRLEIAFADQEIILDHAAERRQRQHDAAMRGSSLSSRMSNTSRFSLTPSTSL
jgi:hypothetical protein